jgi:small subunit ribosomal protein S2
MPKKLEYQELLDAGVHFGHLKRKWNPKMAPYIFMEKNGIHIIDLNKTIACFDEAASALKNIVKSGRKVLFVATKKQAKEIVEEEAKRLRMPYVTERWLGGMLTNFVTIKKSLKKMAALDKMIKDDSFSTLAKKERLMIMRERDKLQKVLGGISELIRVPSALIVVDVNHEHIAVSEARRLNIPVFALVDTNSDPTLVDYPIPANDDSYKSINLLIKSLGQVIEEGLEERRRSKEEEAQKEQDAESTVDDLKSVTETEQ